MDKLEIIKIKNVNYYSSDNLLENCPVWFQGCNNSRAIVNKKDIPETEYTYAKNKNNKWIISDGSSKKFDRLFITKEWIQNNVPEFNDKINYDIELAPEIIELNDNEKFIDNEGNIIEIEVRGEREYDKCYFKVKDIMEGFKLIYLNDSIINKNGQYEEYKHYKYFNLSLAKKIRQNKNKKKIKKELFLTYKGLLRVLFASHKNTADKFVDWATKILFTVQMGTNNQKDKLITDIIGATPDTIKTVFNQTTDKISCIYLFYLGKVKDLKKSLRIDDKYYNENDGVYKWGMTQDLDRRTKEHNRNFSKIKNVNLQLILFNYIDPQYLSKAEMKIKKLFKEMELNLKYEKYSELVIVPNKNIKFVKENYETISSSYIGNFKEMIIKIKEKDHEMELLKKSHEIELFKKAHENELLKKDNELLMKELEILELKSKLKSK